MRKILPYLLLNIFVSALTMLAVLLIWNATHKSADKNLPVHLSDDLINIVTPTEIPLPSLDADTLSIQTVIGTGDINNERVQIKSVSVVPLSLKGWRLVDGNKTVYTFPMIFIYPGGGLNLFTKAGMDTSIELYCGKSASVWKNGETVVILDSAGNERATYLIP